MEMHGWLGFGLTLVGLLCTCSACYEWQWFWRLSRGALFGHQGNRIFYIAMGILGMGLGIGFLWMWRYELQSSWFFLASFLFAGMLAVTIYNSRRGQSIRKVWASLVD